MINFLYVIAGRDRAYVGRTCCPKRRLNDHRWGGRSDVKALCREGYSFLVSSPMHIDKAKAAEVRLIKWLHRGDVVLLNRDLPSRSEMVRRLIERATAEKKGKRK